MAPDTARTTTPSLLTSKVKVPQHVVYRSFPSETVVLNLQTGKYHGLNATAGRMLEALEQAACVRDAAAALTESYEQAQSVIEQDLCELCQSLLERGLIETDGRPAP
jgi:Coenzyme PQQ synthesis protein D (PqqD).